jgi:DNA-binding cell septation regulator SpoVG
MRITDTRIKLMPAHPGSRLIAFACILIDDAFAVRDLKVVQGDKGLFVAMPSRKLTDRWVVSQQCVDPCAAAIAAARHEKCWARLAAQADYGYNQLADGRRP